MKSLLKQALAVVIGMLALVGGGRGATHRAVPTFDTIQYSTTHRNNNMADITTQLGTTAYLLIYTGSPPANCAAAATGTLLASLPCSNPFGAAPSSGVLTASAITSASAAATGTAGYWRLCTSSAGTTVIAQGTIYSTVTLTTSALTAANSNVLNFASGGTAAVAGMAASGTGIPTGATVLASTATTVTLSLASTAGVAASTVITFGGDLTLNSTSISSGQTVSVSSFTITATGA